MEYYINDFHLFEDGSGWAVGKDSNDNGIILGINDYGNSWYVERDDLSSQLNAISVKDSLIVAVGDNGLIIKSKNNGITWVDEKNTLVKSKFALSQNYPNPFNPSTTINYSLPEKANVTITLYDLLGNEIQEIVDDVKAAGNYKISFNANDLASGVYFYQIKAGNFFATKKMVLIK
jgi:hypothetical protein